ncbi:MAG TPA: DUF2249 domain-containing protein [Parafilimonas sp.]|nr:DUF2249 domain-containing protein [Parafilimonas sp.]
MIINANTKIAAILKYNPAALDAIISISPKFEKLRNPVLRKLMAGRASISMASKIGGCKPDDFFEKLQPFGFEVDKVTPAMTEEKNNVPDFITSIQPGQIVILDVRPVIASGKDPLQIILEKIKTLQVNQVLKIINSFEPTPLMILLQKQGFESYADVINEDLTETYFYRKTITEEQKPDAQYAASSANWDEIITRFNDKIQTIDVRSLEMPLPMLTILDALDKLPADRALYVYHKRIPVFLLPELAQRKFDYRIKEISNSEVHLLIFTA